MLQRILDGIICFVRWNMEIDVTRGIPHEDVIEGRESFLEVKNISLQCDVAKEFAVGYARLFL